MFFNHKSLIKIIIFLGKKTFLGRSFFKRILIRIIEYLVNINNVNINNPLFITKIFNFNIYFFSDHKTEMKIYFERKESKEINYLTENLSKNGWFIDIGSNIGLYSLSVASLNTPKKIYKILSIEPNPKAIKRLKNNFELLEFEKRYLKKRFYIIKCAIGKNKKKGYLDISENIENAKVLKKKIGKKLVKIKIDKIHNLIKRFKIKKISGLKIDTEGYEKEIIKSLFVKSFSKEKYPEIMIIEHNNSKKYHILHKFILQKGYKVVFKSNSNYVYRF